MSNAFAPELSDEQWQALPCKERALRRFNWYRELPTQEDGPPHLNRGELIDQFNTESGAPLGSPWCGSIAGKCFKDSGAHLPFSVASSHAWVRWAQNNNRIVTAPARGDMCIFLFSESEGHVTQVRAFADGIVSVIAGNTNEDGSRDGWEVADKDYSLSPLMHFISMDGVD